MRIALVIIAGLHAQHHEPRTWVESYATMSSNSASCKCCRACFHAVSVAAGRPSSSRAALSTWNVAGGLADACRRERSATPRTPVMACGKQGPRGELNVHASHALLNTTAAHLIDDTQDALLQLLGFFCLDQAGSASLLFTQELLHLAFQSAARLKEDMFVGQGQWTALVNLDVSS